MPLLILAVLFEVVADVFLKRWATDHRSLMLASGLGIYFLGTILWAFSLRETYLSKAVTIFTLLNLVAVVLLGVFLFDEHLNGWNKLGIVLAALSIILLEV